MTKYFGYHPLINNKDKEGRHASANRTLTRYDESAKSLHSNSSRNS